MFKKYFQNRGLEYYCSALANLLVEINVYTGGNLFIDDGKKDYYPRENLNVLGVLELRKNVG